MNRNTMRINQTALQKLVQQAKKKSLYDRHGLSLAMVEYGQNLYNYRHRQAVYEKITQVLGKNPTELKQVEQFWTLKMKNIIKNLVGKDFLNNMIEISHLMMKGQFSHSMYRRSYRSNEFGYHAYDIIDIMCALVVYPIYHYSIKEALLLNHDYVRGYDFLLALALVHDDHEIVAMIEEAILGDQEDLILSHKMIRAIILSEHPTLFPLLMKLLTTAGLQEGLRQAILESADFGSKETLLKIMQVCEKNNLFRFSSATRAFGVWTGFDFTEAKQPYVNKCVSIALSCLKDPDTVQKYLNSGDALELYFALWAQACTEVSKTDQLCIQLLKAKEKYKKLVGWMYISGSDSPIFQFKMAKQYLDETDSEILAWVVFNLPIETKLLYAHMPQTAADYHRNAIANPYFPASAVKRRELFQQLITLAKRIPVQSQTFSHSPFPFNTITLDGERVISCILSVVGYDMNDDMVEEMESFLPLMNVAQRHAYYVNFLDISNKKQREIFHHALYDRASQVKMDACQLLSYQSLEQMDLMVLKDCLLSKNNELKQSVLAIFAMQTEAIQKQLITELLASEQEYQIQSGIEMLLKHQEWLSSYRHLLEQVKKQKLMTQTQILLDQINPQKGKATDPIASMLDQATLAHDREIVLHQVQLDKLKWENQLYSKQDLKSLLQVSFVEIKTLFDNMNAVFKRHADYEYEIQTYSQGRMKVLFGYAPGYDIPAQATYGHVPFNERTIEMIPFGNEFLETVRYMSFEKLLVCHYITASNPDKNSYSTPCQWYIPFLETYCWEYHQALSETFGNEGYGKLSRILALIIQSSNCEEIFLATMKIYRSLIAIIGKEQLYQDAYTYNQNSSYYYAVNKDNYAYLAVNTKPFIFWRHLLSRFALSPEHFKSYFYFQYNLDQASDDRINGGISLAEFLRACDQNLISQTMLLERLLTPGKHEDDIFMLTNWKKNNWSREWFQKYSWLRGMVDHAIDVIVAIEEKRGEMPTSLTSKAGQIYYCEGGYHFISLLAALGKETFYRGYDYYHGTDKKTTLSRLLKHCYPKKEESITALKQYLKDMRITDQRFVEAAVYAPQWAGLAEEILGWPGLKSGIWFFQAHINENFSAEKETEVALYSPISPQQFNDGAFDRDWFISAYQKLGDKRFEKLYRSAKYITNGSNAHRRSQLYTDAVLNRLDEASLKQEIIKKRHQEKLRAYALIPVRDKKDALTRYEFIQTFLKQSKQFGAQRRESEGRACRIALENLAITTGYHDVNRMRWALESEKMDTLKPLFEPQNIDGVDVSLMIDDGCAALAIHKNGKALKSVPKAIAKNDWVMTLKETVKELKEMQRRSKESLEKAMVESTWFSSEELSKLQQHPVLAPMIKKLLWTDNQAIDFLMNIFQDGKAYRIAHPYDLVNTNTWTKFIHLFYEEKIIQPFRQVFREYYPLTEDEKAEKNVSRRYAGYQVQPKKTVALLKGCGWTVDYDVGLQKVFYKEDLIVRMYALADWFSPSDIEAPTLEVIRFYNRQNDSCVDLESIPPIVFSETMRNLDLVVSTAYVGGVDPETSQSSIALRSLIGKELCTLLKLNNVSFEGHYAKVSGKYGHYAIHLGSGIIHQEGKGAIQILPVHSQSRGRIFLPFADDDPKSAEIMAKIILLAEDEKIKDPSILNQIV